MGNGLANDDAAAAIGTAEDEAFFYCEMMELGYVRQGGNRAEKAIGRMVLRDVLLGRTGPSQREDP